MTDSTKQVLVLRHALREGNYVYRVAQLPADQATAVRQRLMKGESAVNDLDNTFGQPLSLDEVMRKLQSRDFQVLDYPTEQMSNVASS